VGLIKIRFEVQILDEGVLKKIYL
jgi:hypothetical protein